MRISRARSYHAAVRRATLQLEPLEPRLLLDAPVMFLGFESEQLDDVTALDADTGDDLGSVLPFSQIGAFPISDITYGGDKLFLLSSDPGNVATIYSYAPSSGQVALEGSVTFPRTNYYLGADDLAHDPAQDRLYVWGCGPDDLAVFDVGTQTDLGCPITSGTAYALDICWGNGRLYILDPSDGGRLAEFDPSTGAITTLAQITGRAFNWVWDNLAYDPSGNDLYISSYRSGPNEIIRFDLDSMTEMGCPVTSGTAYFSDIVMGDDGLYIADMSAGEYADISMLDLSTGAISWVGRSARATTSRNWLRPGGGIAFGDLASLPAAAPWDSEPNDSTVDATDLTPVLTGTISTDPFDCYARAHGSLATAEDQDLYRIDLAGAAHLEVNVSTDSTPLPALSLLDAAGSTILSSATGSFSYSLPGSTTCFLQVAGGVAGSAYDLGIGQMSPGMEANDSLETAVPLSLPMDVSARLSDPTGRDFYVFDAVPGTLGLWLPGGDADLQVVVRDEWGRWMGYIDEVANACNLPAFTPGRYYMEVFSREGTSAGSYRLAGYQGPLGPERDGGLLVLDFHVPGYEYLAPDLIPIVTEMMAAQVSQ